MSARIPRRGPLAFPPDMADLPFPIDPKELVPAGVGFVLGCAIMAALVAIGLVLGCSPSIQFGIPYQ